MCYAGQPLNFGQAEPLNFNASLINNSLPFAKPYRCCYGGPTIQETTAKETKLLMQDYQSLMDRYATKTESDTPIGGELKFLKKEPEKPSWSYEVQKADEQYHRLKYVPLKLMPYKHDYESAFQCMILEKWANYKPPITSPESDPPYFKPLDFFREISKVVSDEQWSISRSRSKDGEEILNLSKGDAFRFSIRPSNLRSTATVRGTAIDAYIGKTAFKHLEDS